MDNRVEITGDMKMNIKDYIDERYKQELDIERFSQLFNNKTQSYKYYWFDAIINRVVKYNQQVISFDELIDDMICEAWRTVNEYHLRLGLISTRGNSNFLEQSVNKLHEKSGLSSTASYEDIKRVIEEYNDEIRKERNGLQQCVPYRLVRIFVRDEYSSADFNSPLSAYSIINEYSQNHNILYHFEKEGRKRYIVLSKEWMELIKQYNVILHGWTQHEKIKYLESRNPGVPGIASKLEPAGARQNLNRVSNMWKTIMDYTQVNDIYSKDILNDDRISIDHFIPWNYVAADEIWNLIPTKPGVNLSKSNKLASWDDYFNDFAQIQYIAYDFIQSNIKVAKKFETARKVHLNSIWADELLYRPNNTQTEFINILSDHMKPVYEAAKMQGFELWLNPYRNQ